MNQNVKDLVDSVMTGIRTECRDIEGIEELVASAINTWQVSEIEAACKDLDTLGIRAKVEAVVLPRVAAVWPLQSIEDYIEGLRSAFVIEATKCLIYNELKGLKNGN